MNKINNSLIIGIILLCCILTYLFIQKTKENFDTHDNTNVDVNVDLLTRNAASSLVESVLPEEPSVVDNKSDYIRRSDIEKVAQVSTREYCPVGPDYNPNNYVKKSQIDFIANCPKMPDLKDYVLKSTIPPIQKCPSCICPKVKVTAGMCKKCPEVKENNCPKPQPCGIEQCKDVIKCPDPVPCPKPPMAVCPSIKLDQKPLKCPETKPCPKAAPCRDGQGRCPEQKSKTKCKYLGIKEDERSIESIVDELIKSNDPKLKDLLNNLKNKLDLNNTLSPSQIKPERNSPSQEQEPQNNVYVTQPSLAVNSYEITEQDKEYDNHHHRLEVNKNYKSRFDTKPYSNSELNLLSLNTHNNEDKGNNYCPYNTNLNI